MRANLKPCFETFRRKVLTSVMLASVLCLSVSRDWRIPILTKPGLDFYREVKNES